MSRWRRQLHRRHRRREEKEQREFGALVGALLASMRRLLAPVLSTAEVLPSTGGNHTATAAAIREHLDHATKRLR